MKTTTMAVVVLAAVALSGCASMVAQMGNLPAPGKRVDATEAARWGCDHEVVMSRAAQYKADLTSATYVYRPRVGWTACDLLAYTGKADDVDLQEGRSGQAASWWYHVNGDPRLVSLDREGRQWIVRYVGWS